MGRRASASSAASAPRGGERLLIGRLIEAVAHRQNAEGGRERRLGAHNHALAEALAALPERIRGFGHVKAASIQAARARHAQLQARFRGYPVARVIPIQSRAA